MSILNSSMVGAGGYDIGHSLRFRSSASAYLSRTFGTPTDGKKWTYSVWMKKAKEATLGHGSGHLITTAGSGAQGFLGFGWNAGVDITFGYSGYARRYTNAVFRDPSAWYHILVAVDTTQATEANRALLYVNGVSVPWVTNTAIGLNDTTQINQAVATNIGRQTGQPYESFDGYLAEVNFIDGQALDPSYFGQTNSDGVWVAKKYAGTYGTNGFYLDFSTGTSTTTLGYDKSGNGNNWTSSGHSVTAGATYDWMEDTPTNNYAVLNPLDKYTNVTVSNGNLDSTFSAFTGFVRASFAFPSTGKWYWEGTVPTTNVRAEFGIATLTQALGVDPQGASGCWFLYSNGTSTLKFNAGTGTSWGTAWVSGDIIGIAFDADAGTLTYYKNGTLQGGGAAATGLTGIYAPMIGFGDNTSTAISINFGQRPFSFTPPTGFKALNTQNLPAVAITSPKKYFDVKTQLGSAVNTGANLFAQFTDFSAGLVAGKDRAASNNWQWLNEVTGNTAVLHSNDTGAETTYSAPTSGDNCVAFGWKANGSGVSNTAGTITSTVSANTTAGFSICTLTASTSPFTFGHGLGAVPGLVIFKDRNVSIDWWVSHTSIGTNTLRLNLTNAQVVGSYWGTHTSTVVNVANPSGFGMSASPHVAYCFAAVAGYSAFGSYTGNGSADGPFVYCGFRPRYVMVKRTDTISNWTTYDTARDAYNASQSILIPNASSAEYSGTDVQIDVLSNGFKLRTTNADRNASGGTYIFAAFAESPFGGSNVAPSPAR